jgi:hypothetical protein
MRQLLTVDEVCRGAHQPKRCGALTLRQRALGRLGPPDCDGQPRLATVGALDQLVRQADGGEGRLDRVEPCTLIRTLKPVGTYRSWSEPTVTTVLSRTPPEARRDSGMRYQHSSGGPIRVRIGLLRGRLCVAPGLRGWSRSSQVGHVERKQGPNDPCPWRSHAAKQLPARP